MNEVKWIKVVVDIFDDEKIKIIDSMPDANAIIVIWFKLLCLAGKSNNEGVFMFQGRIPYTEEMFAAIFNRPINSVKLALATFENLGMIEITDKVVSIPKWNQYQNFDAINSRRMKDRERQRAFREKQKRLISAQTVDVISENDEMSRDSNVTVTTKSRDVTLLEEDIDRDIEKDIYIDIKRDIDKEIGVSNVDSAFPAENASPVTKPKPTKEPAVYQIPLNDGSMHDVTQSDLDQYRKLYPALDVDQEIRNIIAWNLSNPKRRKTKTGIKSHITSWLSRSQNRGWKQAGSAAGASNPYAYTYDDKLPY